LRAWATGKFTTTEAFKHDLKSDRAVRGWLAELAKIGAVEQTVEPKGNRRAEWQLTEMDVNQVAVSRFELPDLRDLEGA
jgi:DNA-binding HxlR family transcriptional regulator